MEPTMQPLGLSFPLPKAPETRIHLQLTIRVTSLLLFLTTAMNGDTSTAPPLGSFVYALPDVRCSPLLTCIPNAKYALQRVNPGQTISTPLYTYESSVEFTTRLARLLARNTGKPVYVGNSISFASAGMGGTVEEEIEGFKKVVEVVMAEVRKHDKQLLNGTGGT